MMTTTAWRFRGTEGADEAVLKLKQLNSQDLIDLEDVTVIRWPHYATTPHSHEHVTDEGRKVTALMNKLNKGRIDGSMLEAVKGDLMPGTSAVVLMSSDTAVETVVKALEGQPTELIRSDLSVQQQDRLRAAFGEPGTGIQPQQPGGPA
jgi:uncharacterized membrane protein